MTQSALRVAEPQRLRALERANAVRLARADLKRRIAEGDVTAAEILVDCPWEASSWSIGDLLMSQHRWGAMKCRKFLMQNRINEKKPVGQLTARQRQLLADQLARRSARELQLV